MKLSILTKIIFSLILFSSFCIPKPKIAPFLWLKGKWEMHRPVGGSRLEIWDQKNEESLTGKGLRIESVDTTLLEQIELTFSDNFFWYVPTVPDQNNAMPIKFKLTKSENGIFTFENPEHDFPQRIVYRFQPLFGLASNKFSAGDSLLVRVETLAGEGIDYGFERK